MIFREKAMTMPDERTRAIRRTREFLQDLLNPAKTKSIPRKIRDRAYVCLRHYPGEGDIAIANVLCPDVFGSVDDDKNN